MNTWRNQFCKPVLPWVSWLCESAAAAGWRDIVYRTGSNAKNRRQSKARCSFFSSSRMRRDGYVTRGRTLAVIIVWIRGARSCIGRYDDLRGRGWPLLWGDQQQDRGQLNALRHQRGQVSLLNAWELRRILQTRSSYLVSYFSSLPLPKWEGCETGRKWLTSYFMNSLVNIYHPNPQFFIFLLFTVLKCVKVLILWENNKISSNKYLFTFQ